MTFLAIVGAITLTVLLGWLSLVYAAMFYYSDESITWQMKNYPIAFFVWCVLGLGLMGLWATWWVYIGTHITIGFS